MNTLHLFAMLLLPFSGLCQNYTSFFTGDESDVTATTTGGLVLMGGATENDQAMQWFLEKANGGDIVVIRTSGSDGYNDYLYSQLGVSVNSVETIVMNNASAAEDPYVIGQIENAEGLWIAGGNQWTYVDEWKDSSVETAINYLLNDKQAVVGGTSAGMAVLGGTYFSAENGTIQSEEALSNPYDSQITLGHGDFLNAPFMEGVVTDQHYNNPDRRGRHVTFMARMEEDLGIEAKGIASNEFTAVCVEPDGTARAFGDYPEYEDYVYFALSNCLAGPPEVIQLGVPLTWDQEDAALKVYKVPATNEGQNTFDLNDWQTGDGGEWQNWWVEFGTLMDAENTAAPDCVTALEDTEQNGFTISPNLTRGNIAIRGGESGWSWRLFNLTGKLISSGFSSNTAADLNYGELPSGVYVLNLIRRDGQQSSHKLVIQ